MISDIKRQSFTEIHYVVDVYIISTSMSFDFSVLHLSIPNKLVHRHCWVRLTPSYGPSFLSVPWVKFQQTQVTRQSVPQGLPWAADKLSLLVQYRKCLVDHAPPPERTSPTSRRPPKIGTRWPIPLLPTGKPVRCVTLLSTVLILVDGSTCRWCGSYLPEDKRQSLKQLLHQLETEGMVDINYKEYNWNLNSLH